MPEERPQARGRPGRSERGADRRTGRGRGPTAQAGGPTNPRPDRRESPPEQARPHAAGHRHGAAGPLVREGEVMVLTSLGGGIGGPTGPWKALHRGPLRLVRLSQYAFGALLTPLTCGSN